MSGSQAQAGRELVQEFFDRLDNQDAGVFDEVFAEDVTTGIYRSGEDEGLEGRDSMKELWTEYWEAFPDLTGVSTELIAEGDRVAAFRREEGTHEGSFRGISPTGEHITFEYGGYLVVEDGTITHVHFRGDMLNLFKQLGVDVPGTESE